ncbi:hypothetical protein TGCAST_388500, partial [Toxoplasma gondii CAST]
MLGISSVISSEVGPSTARDSMNPLVCVVPGTKTHSAAKCGYCAARPPIYLSLVWLGALRGQPCSQRGSVARWRSCTPELRLATASHAADPSAEAEDSPDNGNDGLKQSAPQKSDTTSDGCPTSSEDRERPSTSSAGESGRSALSPENQIMVLRARKRQIQGILRDLRFRWSSESKYVKVRMDETGGR